MRAVEAAPVFIGAVLTMISLMVLPSQAPRSLIVDSWRIYFVVAIATVLAWLALGYLAVKIVGSRRPFLCLMCFVTLPLLPVMLTPLVGWLNARLDRSPAFRATFEVLGDSAPRGTFAGVRLQGIDPPIGEILAEKDTPFLVYPPPVEGARFDAVCHSGAFGAVWISELTRASSNAKQE